MCDFEEDHDTLVRRVIEIDRQHRYPGVKGDLWTDENFPILAQGRDRKILNGRYPIWRTSPKIYRRHTEHHLIENHNYEPIKIIKECLGLGNVLLAGGSVVRMINGVGFFDGDADLFIYGLNEADANLKLGHLISVFKEWHNRGDDGPSRYNYTYRNQYCVSFIINGFKYQVIFRLYKTISEILHGFDLGSAAVGWDGKRLYFTTLSRFAHEWQCNIFDLSRKSPTYQKRLAKYYSRGFSVVFPDLKFRVYKEITIQGFANFSMNRGIMTNHYQNPLLEYPRNNSVEYDDGGDTTIQLHHFNFWLAHNDQLDGLCIFTRSPDDIFTTDQIDTTNLRKLFRAKWFGKDRIAWDSTIGKFIESFYTQGIMRYEYAYDLLHNKDVRIQRWNDWNEGQRDDLMEYIMKQLLELQEKIDVRAMALKSIHTPQWIKENPGQQLTSSIHPTPSDPKQYFGWNYSGFQETVQNRYDAKLELVCIMRLRNNPMRLSKDMAKEVFKYWSFDLYDDVHKHITCILNDPNGEF